MIAALYLRNPKIETDRRFIVLLDELSTVGFAVYRVYRKEDIVENTDLLLSVGGDGTFLSSAVLVGDSGIPVLGVNLGRLGFLSENRPETVAAALSEGKYTIGDRTLLKAGFSAVSGCGPIDGWPYALNEITIHRSGAAMLGVDVSIDGSILPTYWADGLLVATSSGSTAYSLSVGGPIVLPDSEVLIVAPIASHNLNVRPLVVPASSQIEISMRSRDAMVLLTMDNRTAEVDAGIKVSVSKAGFTLKRICFDNSGFIEALVSKLYWGEDIRNSRIQ